MEEEPEEAPPAVPPQVAEHLDERDPDHPGDYDPDDDPDAPDDPDDPHNPEELLSSSSSDDSEDDNVHEVARLENNRLNINVDLLQNLTKAEIICLELACAVRHKKTFESLIDHFKNLNVLFGPKCSPGPKQNYGPSFSLTKLE